MLTRGGRYLNRVSWLTILVGGLGFVISTPAHAQVFVVDSGNVRRLLIPDSSGLAPDTPLNRAMFQGVRLTPAQRDSIDRLARYWRRTNTTRRTRESTPAQINGIVAQLERERLSYRAILTLVQQKRYDANTAQLFAAWLRDPKPVEDPTVKAR